jgi:hypothetical protein
MQHNKTITITAIVGVCFCGATLAKDADSLFFLAPQSATGYGGTDVRKMGEQLPSWIPPEKRSQSTASPEKSSTMLSIGYSNLGWNLTLSSYPNKMITFATSFSFFHENTDGRLLLKDALADSLRDSMVVHSVKAPFAVTQKTSLDHIRSGYGIQLNFLPILQSFDFLPFPVNPYIGAQAMVDMSSGSTTQRPFDSLGRASRSFDTTFGEFDTTINRINTDIAFAFPIGLDIFPFRKTTIPIVKNLGISFAYIIYATHRIFAMPDKNVNPYKDYIDNLKNGNTTGNALIPAGTPSGTSPADSSGGSNKGPSVWFGWSPVSSTNEFRVSLELTF